MNNTKIIKLDVNEDNLKKLFGMGSDDIWCTMDLKQKTLVIEMMNAMYKQKEVTA